MDGRRRTTEIALDRSLPSVAVFEEDFETLMQALLVDRPSNTECR